MIRALATMRALLTVRVALLWPDLAKGVRAAAAMLVPFYFARSLGRPELAWTALGGWLGTLADPGGSRATRARALVAFAFGGALVVGAGEASAGSAWTAAPVLAVATLSLSLLRAFGGTATSIGTLLAMTTAIACAGARTVPVRDAGAFAAGAFGAAILSSMVWPVWTHLPVRRAVAAVYGALAAYASAAENAVCDGVAAGDPRWSAIVRDHHRRIRASIEEARAVALAMRARRVGETPLGSNVRSLLGAAEAQFPWLATAVQQTEGFGADTRPAAAAALASVAAANLEIERVLATPVIASRAAANRACSDLPVAPPALFGPLCGLAHDAVVVAHSLGTPRTVRESVVVPVVASAPLRDALSLRSTVLRHALRCAAAALVASLVGSQVSPHSYWVTLTSLAVLQPYTGATVKRAGERVLGTVLGSAAALIVIVTVRSPSVLSAVLVPLSIAAVATRARSYRLFTFFLTPVFVMLAGRHFGEWTAAAERVVDAVLGGGIAVATALLVFPESDRDRLPETLASLLVELAAYARHVLEGGSGGAAANAVLRRNVGIAFGEAEASLERYLAEPRREPVRSANAMLLITHARRLSAALTSLDMLAASTGQPSAADRAIVAGYVRRVLDAARVWIRGESVVPDVSSPPPVTLPAGDPLRRVLDSTVLVAALGGRSIGAAAVSA